MATLKIYVEWPTGGETIEEEVEEGLSDEVLKVIAEDLFFNRCNFGYEIE